MTTKFTRRQSLALAAAAALAPRFASAADAPAGLPKSMIWSTYDVGSTGYVEASAIADALIKSFGTRVRLLPSGSGIGRILPLKQGKAMTAWLANELFFATRGLYEFGGREWGPQDMRVICGRPASFGIAVTAESGIKTMEDLRGKRFAYAAANPSVSVKNDTLLAAAGMTRADVQVIEFPSYGDSLRALTNGQADATGASTTSGQLSELEASPRGISWIELDPNDEAIWEGMQKVAPIFAPYLETVGAGITGKKPVNLAAYRYPMITVYADANADEVYGFFKGLDEVFPDFKDSAPIMARWDINIAGKKPMDAPFHEGAIRYLKEKGLWDEASQKWNDAAVKQITELRAAWAAWAPGAAGLSDAEFEAAWAAKRDAIMHPA